MFDITRNGIITMNRGDTWKTEIFVNLGTTLDPYGYPLGDNDYLYFGVMEPNQPFDFALIRKRYDKTDATPGEPDGYYTIRFDVEDTEKLLPGSYYYEVKLLREELDDQQEPTGKYLVDTIIPRTKFVIYE